MRRIFTISENPKLNTTETITQWMNEKVGQINTVIEKDPDMFSEAKEILENIHKIKGLEKVKKLKELGFTCSKEGIIRPNTLHWEEESGSSNYNIRLADGYEVKDGKIVQKVNILTSEKAKVGQSAIEYFKELVDS